MWAMLNLLKGPATVRKIHKHWKQMRRLWRAFEQVAEHALNVGARVFVEWPRQCRYWGTPTVRKFLAKHNFVNADFDGCMYGLVAGRGEVQGMPIKKPWRVACSPNSSLPSLLHKRCDRSHEHTRCAGVNTLATQGYTEAICKLVHQSICHDIAKLGMTDAGSHKIACVAESHEAHGSEGGNVSGAACAVALAFGIDSSTDAATPSSPASCAVVAACATMASSATTQESAAGGSCEKRQRNGFEDDAVFESTQKAGTSPSWSSCRCCTDEDRCVS